MHKVEHTTKLFNFLFDTCNYKQQAICIISTMHLLFSNLKKTSKFISSGKLFLCSCFYNNIHVLVPAYTTLTKFSPDKDIHKIDRYWSLACYRSIFKVHSKCIYAIILHTTQALNNTSGHLQTKYWQKKDLKIYSSLSSFPKKSNF